MAHLFFCVWITLGILLAGADTCWPVQIDADVHESRSVLSYMRRCCCCFLCSCCCDGDTDVARDNSRKQRVRMCALLLDSLLPLLQRCVHYLLIGTLASAGFSAYDHGRSALLDLLQAQRHAQQREGADSHRQRSDYAACGQRAGQRARRGVRRPCDLCIAACKHRHSACMQQPILTHVHPTPCR